MRILLALGAFIFFLTSCSSPAEFREPIEKLASEWEHTTTAVTDFVNTLQSAQQDLQNQFAQMTVPEELTLSEESQKQVSELKENYQEELGSLTDLSREISNFVSGWQEQVENLTELKHGLETDDLGTDTMSKIEALKTAVANGQQSVENWTGELEDIQSNAADALEQFHMLIANLQGN